MPSIVIPVVLIIILNALITSNKIAALEIELLTTNVNNIIAQSESGYRTIHALGMAEVTFYSAATKNAIALDLDKNLRSSTSISIINTQSNQVLYSYPQSAEIPPLTEQQIQAMVLHKQGNSELDEIATWAEEADILAAYGTFPTWDWLIVSYVDKNHLLIYTQQALTLSSALAGIFMLVILGVVYRMSLSVSESTETLAYGAMQLAANHPDVKIDIAGDNEFSRLANSFNTMSKEITHTQNQLKQSIAEEKKTNVSLLASQQEYQNLVDGLPDLVTKVDAQRRILFVNHVANKIYGLSPKECIGRNAFDFIHPDDQQNTLESFNLWLESEDKIFFHENRQVSSHGQIFHMSWVILKEDSLNDGELLFTSTARDVTEQKEIEVERIKLEKQLFQSQKMEAVGQLAGGIAHDINNMLVVILGHAELSLLKPTTADFIASNMQSIIQASTHSAELIRQLLTFARKQAIAPKVIDLNHSITIMLTMLQQLIGENIQLSIDQQTNLWPVNVDSSQVDQIIVNLCVNARDAIEDIGSIKIKTVNYKVDKYSEQHEDSTPSFVLRSGDYVQVSVMDDGCGMTDAVLERVFEPFYTTKDLGKGTGLGLSTVFGAVKQNNGFVEIQSKPKLGTTINLYFPREKQAVPITKSAVTKASHKGSGTVLIVEDEESLLEIETIMLEQKGYKVLAASTVTVAETLTRENAGQIDLLLTDVIMPQMNGKDLAVKLLGISPNMKIIFMSGYTSDIITTKGVLADNIPFILKPFSMETLACMVNEVLDN
jgi:PAS domain S-box-containing protein